VEFQVRPSNTSCLSSVIRIRQHSCLFKHHNSSKIFIYQQMEISHWLGRYNKWIIWRVFQRINPNFLPIPKYLR